MKITDGPLRDITNTRKQRCSQTSLKSCFLNKICAFGVDFEIRNFVDIFIPKHKFKIVNRQLFQNY